MIGVVVSNTGAGATAYAEVVAEFSIDHESLPEGRFGVRVLCNGTASINVWAACVRSDVGGSSGGALHAGSHSSRSFTASSRNSTSAGTSTSIAVTCTTGIDGIVQGGVAYTAPLPMPTSTSTVMHIRLHVYVDGGIVEVGLLARVWVAEVFIIALCVFIVLVCVWINPPSPHAALRRDTHAYIRVSIPTTRPSSITGPRLRCLPSS